MIKIVSLMKFAFIVLVCVTTIAHAQQKTQLTGNYPNKSVRILVGSAAGGGLDFAARVIAAKLSERSSNSFIIENRAGGSGVIAMDVFAKASPDGYTLLVASTGELTNAALIHKSYDFRKAFEPVALFTSQPYVLVVNASFPGNSVQELIAYAKSNPGKLNYASAGTGTNGHLGMELFKSMSGVDMVHVPYRGIGPGIIDLLGGRIQVLFCSTISVTPHVNGGKVKILGVGSLKRAKFLPNLPTISESGVPGFELIGGYGLLAPVGTPSVIIQALNREVNEILNMPEVAGKFEGADVAPCSPGEYKDFIAKEIDRWGSVMKKSNIELAK